MIILREHEAFTASSSATTSIQLHTPSSVAAASALGPAHPVFPSDHTAHTFSSSPPHLAHCLAEKPSTARTPPQHRGIGHMRWSAALEQHTNQIAGDIQTLQPDERLHNQ